jgi:hypothetical protein
MASVQAVILDCNASLQLSSFLWGVIIGWAVLGTGLLIVGLIVVRAGGGD